MARRRKLSDPTLTALAVGEEDEPSDWERAEEAYWQAWVDEPDLEEPYHSYWHDAEPFFSVSQLDADSAGYPQCYQ